MKMVMPKMGMTMEEGTIVEWKRKEGEYVEKGEVILEIMTNKVNIDVEAPVSGYLKILKGPDEVVPVGEAVALIEESAEGIVPEQVLEPELEPVSEVEEMEVPEVLRAQPTAKIPASPRAKRLAEEHGLSLEEITGTGPGGAVTERDVLNKAEVITPEKPERPGMITPEKPERPEVITPEKPERPEVITEPTEKPVGISSVSPLAERIARDKGVDISKVRGTGLGGKITKEDVLRFIEGLQAMPEAGPKPAEPEGKPEPVEVKRVPEVPEKPPEPEEKPEKPPEPATKEPGIIAEVAELISKPTVKPEPAEVTEPIPEVTPTKPPEPEGIPLTGIKKLTAERMIKSKREAPHLTLGMEVDMTEALKLKTSLTITYTDILVKATALALKAHPVMNSTLQGNKIVLRDTINIGIAVARGEDLLVPVIHNADTLSLRKIAQKIKDLIERTRNDQITEKDVLDGTFTISNLGMYDIDFFTPIINPPEAAILGVGKITEKPVVIENRICIRERTTLSLSFDHRIANGMPAALFLKEIKDLLEHPYKLLVKEEGES